MRFSIIPAVLVFALSSVTAAESNTSDVTATTQKCVKILVDLTNQLTHNIKGVKAFESSQGYPAVFAMAPDELALENKLDVAKKDCCIIKNIVNNNDATVLLGAIDPLVDNIENTLNLMVAKKPDFDALAQVTPACRHNINKIHEKSDAVTKCLVEMLPSEELATAHAYVERIEKAFDVAVGAYA